MLTNLQTGTKNDEVAEGTYRVNTPLMTDAIPGGFKLGQYLVLDRPPGSPASMAALIAARAERCFAKWRGYWSANSAGRSLPRFTLHQFTLHLSNDQ